MNIILIFYLIFIIFSIHINGETKINLNKKYQTIDGFGASSAWQGEVSDKIMDNLFNKVGLSILRIRISEHKEISWDGWQVELSNAKKALKYNALVFASPWKPGNNLADMSLSKSGTIPSNKYNDYADYLQSFVNYMKQNGAPLYAISLQNEPDCASTDWTSQQMVTFLKSSAKRITGVKIMAPESTGFSQQFSEAILNDHEAASKVDIIAGHIYNIVIVNQTKAQQMGKHVWMTEFYTNGKDWNSVIELAKSIHNCINIAQFNAYVHWWFNDNSPNMMLINSNGELTPKGYVMGQFSKFIKRGYVRIDTNSDNNNILISGYIGGQNKLVIVAINIASNSINQQFSINGGSALYTSLTPYITSQGKNLEKQLNIKLNGGKFTYSIPGQSIVTFVNE